MRPGVRVAAATLVVGLLTTSLAAQETAPPAATPDRLRRDPDERGAGIRVGDSLIIGGRFTVGFEDLRNAGLEPGASHREMDSFAQVQASWTPSRRLEAYAKVAALQDATRSAPPAAWVSNGNVRLYEAFVLARRVAGSPIDLRFGRQRIRDTREWFLDEYVDGARVRVNVAAWRAEALIARSLFAGPEANRPRHDKQHLILSASRRVARRTRVEGFLIMRNDRSSRDEDPTWIGASAVSTGAPVTRFWYTVAARRGESGSASLRGWALDGGVSRRLRWPLAPVLTVGYARAAGDDRPGDAIDSTFRQTGLEDNEGRFGAAKLFAYYGVLFEPELSNVQILTGATTLRARRVSLDLVYHRYSRVTARSTVTLNALRSRTSGLARHLGDEWDAIVSFRLSTSMDLNLTAAVFQAGDAYSTHRTAFVWRPQLRIYV